MEKVRSVAVVSAAIVVSGLLAGSSAVGTQQIVDAAATPVTITVHTDEVVQEDFMGVGANIIPFSLMDGEEGKARRTGYDESDWQIDVQRIGLIRPTVARIWFQIDWMELEKGVYNFESPEMKAFYRYLDALDAAGTEVLLNFGWKVGSRVHSWFGIPGIDPTTSAPADLQAYGESASALLQNLWSRGYDNVKHLTYYNEPNGSWDFEAPGDQREYYADMAQAVSDQLAQDGIRDQIEIWGPEEVNASDWTEYMQENAPDAFDQYSFHVYGVAYDDLGAVADARTSVVDGKPVNLTEFGWAHGADSGWEAGYANSVIAAANLGLKSALVWQLNGAMMGNSAIGTNGIYTLWDTTNLGRAPRPAFYEVAPLMRYIAAHSDVVRTESSSADVRAAAFRDSNGQWSVLVETKDGAEKEIDVVFDGGSVSGDFHKIAFTSDDAVPETNGLIPRPSATLAVTGGSFRDEVSEQRTQVIYTQEDPAGQVELEDPLVSVRGGSQTQLNGSILDGSGGLEWSIVPEGNDDLGMVTSGGVYTAPALQSERTVALLAKSVADPSVYAVQQVLVVPAVSPGVVSPVEFSLPEGQYPSAEIVAMATETVGATIRYTLDGSVPTTASAVYDRPIVLEPGTVPYVRALATADGLTTSGVTSRLYWFHEELVAPDGYRLCAYEGQECSFTGEQRVAYGGNGLFSYKIATNSLMCTNAAVGSDPLPGVAKRCYVSEDTVTPMPVVSLYNAGFEQPSTSAFTMGPLVRGWTFTSKSGVHTNGSPFEAEFPAPEGTQTALLKTDGGVSGVLSQEAAFPAGEFAIRFKAAQRLSFGGQQEFDVRIDDVTVLHVVPVGSGEYVEYETDPFTVAAGDHTVSFVATTVSGDNTAFIDEVSVIVPEP